MTLTDTNRDWLQRRAMQAAPYEACGFILFNDEIVEIRNVAQFPERGFLMDKYQVIKSVGAHMGNVAGIWHTHPQGTLVPSATDLYAIKIGAIQSHWDYYIATGLAVVEYDAKSFAPQPDTFWDRFVS